MRRADQAASLICRPPLLALPWLGERRPRIRRLLTGADRSFCAHFCAYDS